MSFKCTTMKLSREDRRSHLQLSEPCVERGGSSTMCRGLLAHVLDTTIPKGLKTVLCHACHNGACCNPYHLYWGTSAENIFDQKENGNFTTGWQKLVNKHGDQAARKLLGDRIKLSAHKGGSAGKGKPKSEEHRRKISEALTKPA